MFVGINQIVIYHYSFYRFKLIICLKKNYPVNLFLSYGGVHLFYYYSYCIYIYIYIYI